MAIWTPAEITTELWLDAADASTITDVAGVVSQWDDKSGNGYTFNTSVSGGSPITNATLLNGLNVIDLDGIGHFQSNSPIDTWRFFHEESHQIYIVSKAGIVADPNALYSILATGANNNSNRGVTISYDDRTASSRDNRLFHHISRSGGTIVTNLSANGFWPANQAAMICVISDPQVAFPATAARSALQNNGVTEVRSNTSGGDATFGSPAFNLRIGAYGNGTADFVGSLCEIVVVKGAYDQARHDFIWGGLCWKWGVQSQLAIGHPYELVAPVGSGTSSTISGTVTLDAVAADRTVLAMSAVTPFSVLDLAASASGNFLLELGGVTDDALVVVLDDYGTRWQASTVYAIGARIRPTVGNDTGYLYEVTTGGDSGLTEPTWWVSGSGSIGAAAATAIPIRLPYAHGPVTPI